MCRMRDVLTVALMLDPLPVTVQLSLCLTMVEESQADIRCDSCIIVVDDGDDTLLGHVPESHLCSRERLSSVTHSVWSDDGQVREYRHRHLPPLSR